jgi:hypothetical protein
MRLNAEHRPAVTGLFSGGRVFPSLILIMALLLIGAAGCGGDSGTADQTAPAKVHAAAGIDQVATRQKLVQRLFIFGIDGATWHFLDPLIKAGKLPTIARLVRDGVRANLQTLEPTVSPAIWTTIATGVLPQSHGILGFDGVPGVSMTTLPNSRMRRVKAYWNILGDFDRTSATVGWWASWPADQVGEGSCMVSDRVPYTRMEAAIKRDSLGPEDVYPAGLLELVAAQVERPEMIDPAAVERFLHFNDEEMDHYLLKAEYRMGSFLPEFAYVYQSDRSTLKISREILADRPFDVTAAYFTGVDTVSHLYWHFTFPDEFPRQRIDPREIERFGQVIPCYYELLDEYLASLLDVLGPNTTVVILSDHGFGGTGNLPWSGGHGRITPGAPIAPAGVLILSGPGIRSDGHFLAQAHVLDVAPTILHLMGIPAASDMPGRVLTQAMAPGSPAELPRVASHETIGTPWNPGEIPVDPAGDIERLERLKRLGYIQ